MKRTVCYLHGVLYYSGLEVWSDSVYRNYAGALRSAAAVADAFDAAGTEFEHLTPPGYRSKNARLGLDDS